jgi:HK97 family phage portal protein
VFLSSGSLVPKSVLWEGTPATWGSWNPQRMRGLEWAPYSAIYREQLWVSIVVNKRAGMVSRLPLKVYERNESGRREARLSPYALLLRKPSSRIDPALFWTWTSATFDVYGEAFWAKLRDRGGRPIELLPLHPTAMTLEQDGTWTFQGAKSRVEGIPREDLVHFQTYNPESLDRGLSKLEPLRKTLENEDAARRATSAFWRNGARPGVALAHPGNLSQGAGERLKAQWDSIAGGADNTGSTIILEEGMEPKVMMLTAEEAQYIETRKLNREEVVAAYDMPPPAVHILDRATFSNITAQFRSVYRDTMGPILGCFESVLEFQLRASVRPGASEPDFGDEVYAEFLMDEVLRGDFESRQEAYRQADYMTIAEKRQRENLPYIEGTDRIVVNAATIPLDMLDVITQARAEHGRLSDSVARSVMGRLSRKTGLDQVDPVALTAGIEQAPIVLAALTASKNAGDDLAGFKARLRALTEE